MARLLGYARLSAAEPDAAPQQDALGAAGCRRVWTDGAADGAGIQPRLTVCLAALRAGDTLVVWRLDRLAGSLPVLLDRLVDLHDRRVGFRSLTESVDTTAAGGDAVSAALAALGGVDRQLGRDRVEAGRSAARARGRAGGRPTVMTPDRVAAARSMLGDPDRTMAQIAEVLGVSRSALYRGIRRPAADPAPMAGEVPAVVPATDPAPETAPPPGRSPSRKSSRKGRR